MDLDNLESWLSQPDVCRCCLSASGTWDLTASYVTEAGVKEVFSDILQECYGISLSCLAEWGPSRLLCALCVGHLRDATSFRKQVLEAERYFTEYLTKKDCIEMVIKTEPDLDSTNDLQQQIDAPRTDNSSTKYFKSTSNQNKSTRKRHKPASAVEKKRTEDSDCDSDTPLTLLSKRSQNIDINNIEDDIMHDIDGGCEEADNTLDISKAGHQQTRPSKYQSENASSLHVASFCEIPRRVPSAIIKAGFNAFSVEKILCNSVY